MLGIKRVDQETSWESKGQGPGSWVRFFGTLGYPAAYIEESAEAVCVSER